MSVMKPKPKKAALTLAELQQAFLQTLGGQSNDDFNSLVVDNTLSGKMGKAQRIDIYQRNHIGARVSALENIYPICQQILGDEAFFHIAELVPSALQHIKVA